METGRAEFTAILTALHSIIDTLKWDNDFALKALERKRATVIVTSDREDLVGSINRVFKREKNRDLWVQFEWYEKYFDICAVHVKRDTHPTHNIVDAIASEMRIVLIDFFNTQREVKHI